MKYKVIKEYPRFYLCESEFGYKECFDKKYQPNDGIITIEKKIIEGHEIKPENVNRLFNPGVKFL